MQKGHLLIAPMCEYLKISLENLLRNKLSRFCMCVNFKNKIILRLAFENNQELKTDKNQNFANNQELKTDEIKILQKVFSFYKYYQKEYKPEFHLVEYMHMCQHSWIFSIGRTTPGKLQFSFISPFLAHI